MDTGLVSGFSAETCSSLEDQKHSGGHAGVRSRPVMKMGSDGLRPLRIRF